MGKEGNREERGIFVPLRWEGSFVIWFGSFIANVLTFISVTIWIDKLIRRLFQKESLLVAEIWVIALLLLEVVALLFGENAPVLMWIVAVYALVDVLGATLRDIVMNPQRNKDKNGGYIAVRSGLRWMLMVPMNVMQILVGFAILFLFYGEEFIPQIKEPMIALYQSALTFTTLGYGDIRPESTAGRIVVCLELGFFLIFLGMKLPIAVSVLRVKETGMKNNGKLKVGSKPKKKKVKIFIGAVGISLTVLGWLCANSSDYAFVRRAILPKYSIAISTYKKMTEKGFVLNNGEIGFAEISELIEDGIKTIEPADNTFMLPPKWEHIKNKSNLEITRVETLEKERGIGYYDKVTTCLKLRIFSNKIPPFDLPIENMQDWIEDRYNNDIVFFWGNCVFFLGVIVSVVNLLV